MEYIDIRDEKGRPTGIVKKREEVHRDGELHGCSHVWILRDVLKGENMPPSYELLLQKRSQNKESWPGCYDISSAGHIPAGDDYLPSALRELEEELGLRASEGDLIPLGMIRYHFTREFHGKIFDNHEISKVYLYRKPVDTEKLTLQVEEVEEVRWIDFYECLEKVRKKDPQFCIMEEELRMIGDYLMNRP